MCAILIHESEEEACGCGDQCVHGLVEELRREDAPDKEMVAQCGDQHDVEHSRDRAHQGEAVATVAKRDRSETEKKEEGGKKESTHS